MTKNITNITNIHNSAATGKDKRLDSLAMLVLENTLMTLGSVVGTFAPTGYADGLADLSSEINLRANGAFTEMVEVDYSYLDMLSFAGIIINRVLNNCLQLRDRERLLGLLEQLVSSADNAPSETTTGSPSGETTTGDS